MDTEEDLVQQPTETNTQQAPYPQALQDLIPNVRLDPGWAIYLEDMDRGQGSSGLTLVFRVEVYDSYNVEAGRSYHVLHYFPVPPAAYDARNWQRWLFDRYCDVLIHEGCEMFVVDGKRPYAPHHGDGEDPYTIFERPQVGDDQAASRRPGPSGTRKRCATST